MILEIKLMFLLYCNNLIPCIINDLNNFEIEIEIVLNCSQFEIVYVNTIVLLEYYKI